MRTPLRTRRSSSRVPRRTGAGAVVVAEALAAGPTTSAPRLLLVPRSRRSWTPAPSSGQDSGSGRLVEDVPRARTGHLARIVAIEPTEAIDPFASPSPSYLPSRWGS